MWKYLAVGAIVIAVFAFFFTTYNINLVQGTSMSPTFGECELVAIDKGFSPYAVKEGDLVVIDVSDKNYAYPKIAHRVTDNQPSFSKMATKGDNTSIYPTPTSIDDYFDYTRFNGKIVWHTNMPAIVCAEKSFLSIIKNGIGGENK